MSVQVWKQTVGDTATARSWSVTNAAGTAINLTGKDVSFRMIDGNGTVIVNDDPTGISVTNAAAGEGTYTFAADEVATTGIYYAWIVVEDPGTGLTTLYPEGGHFVVLVVPQPEPVRFYQYSYNAIRTAIADFLGWGRNTEGGGNSWTTEDESRMDSIIRSALAKAYYPVNGHVWSWMLSSAPLATSAPYKTGTVEIVSGVVTLTGGEFPAWAIQGELSISSGVYAVSSRDSDTQITLADASVDADAGTTYSLRRYLYDLPADFQGFDGEITYAPSQSVMYSPIQHTSDIALRRCRQNHNYTSSPQYAALRSKAFDAVHGQLWQVALFPTPGQAYQLEYRYRIEPRILSAAFPNPHGGPEVGELVLQMCLAVAEQRYRDVRGPHTEEADARLVAAITQDLRAYTPDVIGYNADRSEGGGGDGRFSGVPIHSYDGTVYYDRNL